MQPSSDFLLSPFTQAVWLGKGAIVLNRIKDEDDDFHRGYHIIVPYQAVKAVVEKRELIQTSMLALMEGLTTGPTDIALYKNQVLRICEFYDEFYLGFHKLDTNTGKVMIGKGMNLTEEEYAVLLDKLMKRFSNNDDEEEEENKRKRRRNYQKSDGGKKRRIVLEEGSTASTSEKKEKEDKEEEENPQFVAYRFGWRWYCDTGAQYTNIGECKKSEGEWHFDPKSCFSEAMGVKPVVNPDKSSLEGEYKLDVFKKEETINIDEEFMDAALINLVMYNVAKCAAQDRALDIYTDAYGWKDIPTVWSDVEIYGKTVLDGLSLTDIYDLCKKAILQYGQISSQKEMLLMSLFATYEKKDSILGMITNNSINETLTNLFYYIQGI